MKNLFTIFLFLLTTLTFAQSNEGYIVYEMTMEGLPPEAASMMGSMTTKTYFKKGKVLTEVTSKIVNMKTLNDGKETLVLMDQFGQKSYYRTKNSDSITTKEKTTEPKIEYTEEKKTIAGYECKKAIITIETEEDKTQKVDVWYTDKLDSTYVELENAQFKGLKGVPLEYDLNMNGMKMKMFAKEVSTKEVSDSKFALSTVGYTEVDISKLQGR